ncbi:CopD family protein [Thiothrix winogradskyi]|uniref:CopD family protein n=1 Tax=Thiothrix winogradskyi TaxID=96472 RepID=A0ABY3SUN0_9GAMM|nr:CopD family protein [Thiothrix winogradskyi]UJS22849.1 CopD family protein [Thiothrix winogradskyi]
MSIALALHVLAVVIWVGGMFFAYMALRPVAATVLEPPQRLTLWNGVFGRFFPWVWAAIIIILGSGYWMLLGPYGGFANAPVFVHLMNGLGLVMMLIFFHVYFAPYQKLRKAVAAQSWSDGGKALAQIRVMIGINTLIGVLTILIAAGGKYLP